MPYTMCPRHKLLHPMGGQGCIKCKTERSKRHISKNANARGYTYQWQKIRAAAIAAQPWCTFCGTDKDLTGDHIRTIQDGGQNTIDNVRVLCRGCNTRRENALRKLRRGA